MKHSSFIHRIHGCASIALAALLILSGCAGGVEVPGAAGVPATSIAQATQPPTARPTSPSTSTPDAPTIAPTGAPPTTIPTAIAATATSSVAPTPAPPTATPLFPQQAITADTIAALRQLRYIGYGQAILATLSPDSATLGVATTAGVALFELPARRLLRFYEGRGDISFSPDGRFVALSGNAGAEIRRLSDDQVVLVSPPDTMLSFGPDGRTVAGERQGSTTLWRGSDSTPVGTLAGDKPRFGPAGQIVATEQQSNTLLWSSADGALLHTLTGTGARFSPTGEFITTEADGQTILWRSADGTLLLRLAGAEPIVSRDGQLLVTRDDRDLLLWSVPGGQQLGRITLPAQNDEPIAAAFSRDGQLLRVMIGGTLQVWNVATRQLDTTIEIVKRDAPDGPPSASFAADDTVIVISWGGEIWLARAADGTSLFHDEGQTVTFSADGATAALKTQDGQVRLVALDDGSSSEIDLAGFELLAFSADGRTLATGGDNVHLWRVVDGTLQQTLPVNARRQGWEFGSSMRGLRFSPDGRLLAVEREWMGPGASNAGVDLWDAEAGSGTKIWSADYPGQFGELPELAAFNPATRAIAWANLKSAKRSGQVQLRGSDGMTLTLTEAGNFTALAFSPDGSLLAVGDANGTLQLFNTAGGSLHGWLQAGGAIGALGFSPDGTLLGARQPDGTLLVWRIGTPEPVARLMPIAPRSAEQNDSAARFIFSADNQLLITNGVDGVNFYRLADGQMLRRLELAAQDIAIGPAGRLFAVLENGRVALWGVPEA